MRITLAAISAVIMIGATTATTPAEIDRLRMHADSGRDPQAMASLLSVAQGGSSDAERAVGEVLLKARDSKRAAEALSWLQRAAEQGDSGAALSLGKTWLFGAPGVASDGVKARAWFEKTGANSQPQAAYYLGLIEKNGYSKSVDFEAAERHFRFAAERGVSDAMYQLGNA